ncbi:MAG: hypothetical protein U0L49_09725 [Eubacterium sp.]|nr:hypothetical protein [Eubacterium sp.]
MNDPFERELAFRTALDSSWAEGLDYFQIHWIYHPENLKLPDGTPFEPDFYLPGQGAFLFTLSEKPSMSYYDILRYQKNSQQLFIISEEAGRFYVLGYTEDESYICRCRVCGEYFFNAGIPTVCPICKSAVPNLADFYLSGSGKSGTGFS